MKRFYERFIYEKKHVPIDGNKYSSVLLLIGVKFKNNKAQIVKSNKEHFSRVDTTVQF